MISIKSAVYQRPEIEKTANFELSKDASKWNDEIMDQFYEQVDYIPKEIGTDIVINAVDKNKGYAKGSIVAWLNEKKINFPIIVRDYQLMPFDVFVDKTGDQVLYHPTNINNIKKALYSDKMAKLENRYDAQVSQEVKTPGYIAPKVAIPLYDMPEGALEPPYSKMSSLKINKEDLDKLAIQMETNPDVMHAFQDNTGDLITNVLNLKDNVKVNIPDDHKNGPLDLKGVVDAKQAVTIMDSEFFDVDKLIPAKPPMVIELRKIEYPSMEDFIESGKDIAGRYLASKNGKAVVGIVLDMKYQCDNDPTYQSSSEPCRPQVFFSFDGKCYSEFMDYDHKAVGFYGSNVISVPGAVGKVVKELAEKTVDFIVNANRANRNDGSDKMFNPILEMSQGIGDTNLVNMYQSPPLFVLYGAQDAWECMKFYGNFKKKSVNNTNVYVGVNQVIIPAKVGSIQKVESVEDNMFKMIVGKIKNIYLIPETSVIINAQYMTSVLPEAFLAPSREIKKAYESADISKVALFLDKSGYTVEGKPLHDLQKIAGSTSNLGTDQTMAVLTTIGMTKDAAYKAMAEVIKAGSVTIYGVRSNYIKKDLFKEIDKTARVNAILKDIAYGLRQDLSKEASLISDPEAVDAVLSLNFINEENLTDYISNISAIKKIITKLASMLVASRMGLTEIDEDATKKAMDGLEKVCQGLEDVKLAIGK